MSEKILVIDDDDSMLDFAQHALERIGCQVVTMNDPMAALEYLKREEVAVLVSDNNMPMMSGLELIEKANSLSRKRLRSSCLPIRICQWRFTPSTSARFSSLLPSHWDRRTCSILLRMPCGVIIPSK